MSVIAITDILAGKYPVNESITIHGWIRTRRDSKAGISFLAIHDGSCFDAIQAIAPSNLDNYQTDVLKLTTGAAVKVTGILVESPGKGQSFELQAEQVEVLGLVEDPDTYPMAAKRHSIEFLREQAHLRPRTNIGGAVTRVRNTLAQAVHRFLHSKGYFWISTPLITGSDCEGAGEMFRVFLTVSGQLNVETYCCALSKVYTFGPTFRAENSNTTRHLAEFWMIEPEIAFADLADAADLAEEMLKYVFQAVLDERADDMAFFQQRVDKTVVDRLNSVINNDFVRLDYTDAITILENCGKKFENKVAWGVDLNSEHERYLAEEHFNGPVVLQNYPKDIKSFYMRLNDDGKTVAAMDILAPGIGEIIGGSQREERLDVLDKRLAEMNLDPADYSWYRDLRRYGTVPHSGFGLGFERLVAYATGMQNVRDVIPFPRTPNNAAF
jgi:asparaginyl-tRNA synthetase